MVKPAVVFFHAHPDDEAIFTGGTIARLVELDVRVVVVIATDGGLGTPNSSSDPLATVRVAEAEASCRHLGVDKLHFLGYADSGIANDDPESANASRNAFALANIYEAADKLAKILNDESACALVHYDEGGIYGHSDHLAVHRVGRRAASLAGVGTVYESTVDHEHLHFVETHLVGQAVASLHESAVAGVPTAMVTTTIDVTPVLEQKRTAMAAHITQIGPESEVMGFTPEVFAAVYGHEWYIRLGPAGDLDRLGM